MPPPESLEQVEFVGGPWAAATDQRRDLPDEIPEPGGAYVRSVRCADDGAMRYVWRGGAGEPAAAVAAPGGSPG